MRDFCPLFHAMSLFSFCWLVSFKDLVISQSLLVLLRSFFLVNGNCNGIKWYHPASPSGGQDGSLCFSSPKIENFMCYLPTTYNKLFVVTPYKSKIRQGPQIYYVEKL